VTEQEAIKILKRDLKIQQDNRALIDGIEALQVAIKALSEIQQYRAIGTVEGYEKAIQATTEYYLLMKEYKSKVQDFEAIGTIEEFKALKEKSVPIVTGEWIDTQPQHNNGYYKNAYVCSNCNDYYTTEYDEMKFCPNCGAKMTET
jgi:hypothetical protein